VKQNRKPKAKENEKNMNIPAQGIYQARANGQLVIYITERTGSLCVAIPLATQDANPAWTGKFVATLITGDGTVQQKTIDNLSKCFGIPAADLLKDPFLLMTEDTSAEQDQWTPRDFSVCDLSITGGPNEYQTESGETKVNFKVQWLNPAGEAGGMKIPTAANRADIMKKFGSKLRALAPSPAKAAPKPAAASPAPPVPAKTAAAALAASGTTAAKSKSAGPPKSAAKKVEQQELAPAVEVVEECDMETAWNALTAAKADLGEAEQGQMWYAEVEKMFPGQNNDLTPAQFGALKALFDGMAK
jgi:hypothetical protein